MSKKLLSILLMTVFVSSIILSGCKKDEDNNNPSPVTGKTGTFVDTRDSKEYKWVEIGNQVWMSENLSYTGNDIKNISDNFDWYDNSTADAWSYYDNTESNSGTYGVLYQWKAAEIACPDGWHLPTDADWKELESYLKEKGYSYDGVVGNDKIAKSLATNLGWKSSNNLGAVGNTDFSDYRNVTGFSATASGFRAYTGEFDKNNEECYFWSATKDANDNYGNRKLSFDSSKIYTFHDNNKYGFSVRCIKD